MEEKQLTTAEVSSPSNGAPGELLEQHPAEQPVNKLPHNAATQAMMFIQHNLQQVHKMIDETTSLRQMKRVLHALIDNPLTEVEPKFSYEHEKALFELAAQVQGNKLILLYCSFREQELKDKTQTSEKKETENGTEVKES